jgi:serine/arginine repetitive matrix protein 1
MSIGTYFRGTTHDQDTRYRNKDKKLLESMKFPPEFVTKVDISKVELKVIKSWVENKLTEILGFDDEFCTNYTISMLENKMEELDPRKMQIYLSGK